MTLFDLPALVKRQRNIRRRTIVLRAVPPPAVMASELYRSYAAVLASWAEALPQINAAYMRALSELVTDDAQNMQSVVSEAENAATRLLLTLAAPIRSWAVRVERWQRDKWVNSIKAGTGIDLGMMIGPESARETLETAINWNVALVTDVSDQVRQRISNAVWDGLRNRTNPRDVAARIRESVAMGRKRSEHIAADQLNKLYSSLADERRREAGLSVWEWVHSGKKHPRVEHQKRNGLWYSDDPKYVGLKYEGKEVHAVPDDRPGQLPYCACHNKSVLIFLDED